MSMRPEQIPYGVKDFKRIRLEGRYYVGFEGQTLMVEPTGSSMYCVKGESEKALHGSESGY